MNDSKNIVLIVGLGNPGRKYEYSRHNMGFLTIDAYLDKQSGVDWQSKWDGQYAKIKIDDVDRLFVKPQSFMNLSGKAVRQFLQFYKLEPSQILVIHDEADLEDGDIRLKKGGGAGGHNGLLSIVAETGMQDFLRMRIGVGKSADKELADFLLEKASKSKLLDLASQASDRLQTIFDHGFIKAQQLNKKTA